MLTVVKVHTQPKHLPVGGDSNLLSSQLHLLLTITITEGKLLGPVTYSDLKSERTIACEQIGGPPRCQGWRAEGPA